MSEARRLLAALVDMLERSNTAHLNYSIIDGKVVYAVDLVKAANECLAKPPAINPMPALEISKAFCDETGVSIGDTIEDAFEAGVRFGEKYHGLI